MNPSPEEKPLAEALELWQQRPEPPAPPPPPPASTTATGVTIASALAPLPDEHEAGTDEPVADEMAETADGASSMPALEDWKGALRADFERWLAGLDEIPDPLEGGDDDTASAPDLYTFYEQLALANAESRKANRRTAEAFSQWGDALAKFDGDLRLLREHLARQSAAASPDDLPRAWALALVEIVDRLRRLATAFASPPPSQGWLGSLGADARWRKTWETQRQGFDILLGHVETLLQKAGISRIATLHEPFDPATMSAIATEPSSHWPPQTVLEEAAAGYRLNDELLRVAQVKVSTAKPN